MKIYALVGKSGTGKSFQATNLCRDKQIQGIIDDGLFIFNGEVKAGISAKREPTKIGAVKTALFTKEEHRRAVARKIVQTEPESLLVLGTSDGMVERIVERLELPPISETIYITQITTEGEREIARKQRMVAGKHAVPVPAVQLKRQFSGYLVNSLKNFKSFGLGNNHFGEKSEVRPTYSYLGKFIISDKVIKDIVKCSCTEVDGILSVTRVIAEETRTGIKVTVLLTMDMDVPVLENAKKLQKQMAIMIEEMTAFNLEKLNLEIRTLEKVS